MAKNSSFARFLQDNGLSLLMFGLFAIFLVGLSITGYYHENDTLTEHEQHVQTYVSYITSGSFIEAVFENWESEFLQMAALVLATIFLRQKGAADSKKTTGARTGEPVSRSSIIAGSFTKRVNAVGKLVYANSFSLALIALFLLSFLLHAAGGVVNYNQDALQHGQSTLGMWQYMWTSQFWFESFQNWQSEFLAVGTLLVLSIYLRQQGSPESKPVSAGDKQTGD